MASIKVISICAASAIAFSGCVSHTWAPGPGMSAADFGRTSGQCKLLAESGGSSQFVAASGRPAFVGAFVGASLIGGGIAGAVHKQNLYNDCMEASGFVAADEAPPTQATIPPAQGGHYP